MDKKILKWQFARGLAIIAVVLIHSPNGMTNDIGTLGFKSWMVLRQFINFPVALFIFMTGYFVNPEKMKNYKQYMISRGGGIDSCCLSCFGQLFIHV